VIPVTPPEGVNTADWVAAAEAHWLDAVAWAERAEWDRLIAEAEAAEARRVAEYWRRVFTELQRESAA
jgi:hypothetical protein